MDINKILRESPVSSARGAPMGTASYFDPASPILRLQLLEMVDRDYSPDGTYWGAGNDSIGYMYCAHNETSRIFVRGVTRADAVAHVLRDYPQAIISEEFDLEAMLRGYVECALWSSTDPDTCEPLDDNFGPDDIDPDTLASMREDCADFLESNYADLIAYRDKRGESSAGHDFWLTRNGHGAGFWDRGLGDLGDRLTEAAEVYGSIDLFPCEDGRVRA